jgi:hypothetical protein
MKFPQTPLKNDEICLEKILILNILGILKYNFILKFNDYDALTFLAND